LLLIAYFEDSKRDIEKTSNLSHFELDGIKLQLSQAFDDNKKADFLIELKQDDDYVETKVNNFGQSFSSPAQR
jgi:hypothetical protein